MQKKLENSGVACLPGVEFGRPETGLTLRLAYVDFKGARALAGSEQIPPDESIGDDFIDIYCYKTKKGVEFLCDWIKSL